MRRLALGGRRDKLEKETEFTARPEPVLVGPRGGAAAVMAAPGLGVCLDAPAAVSGLPSARAPAAGVVPSGVLSGDRTRPPPPRPPPPPPTLAPLLLLPTPLAPAAAPTVPPPRPPPRPPAAQLLPAAPPLLDARLSTGRATRCGG